MDQGSDSEKESRKKKDREKKSSKSKKEKDREGHKSSHKESSSNRDTSKSGQPSAGTVDQQTILWDLALNAANSQNGDVATDEKSILFVGSKDSGKSSIIMRFLDRDEPPKPTTALEYTFGRRTKASNMDKDVAHIWELGGGTWLSKLSDVVVNADSIGQMAVALVVDLSKPTELWLTLERWLEVLQARIKTVLKEVMNTDARLPERLKHDAWERVGDDHNDREMLEPLLLPLIIIGSKYDVFQDLDPETRKVVCKTLRFVAHRYGAHLLFCSTKHEPLMGKVRSVISHLVFSTPLSKSAQTDPNKPLLITAGQDSLQQIGSPPLSESELGRVSVRTPMDLWKHAFTTKFPQQIASDPSRIDDPAKDRQYAEAAVDAARIQKDEELERYRKTAERRAREAASKALMDGFVY